MQNRVGRPVLVTGGAGYIGSHVALALCALHVPIIVLDNLSSGKISAVPKEAMFQFGDVIESHTITNIIKYFKIDTVIHLAGSIIVNESMQHPIDYYKNNTEGSRALLSACITGGAKNFIFSSTAAVYGQLDEMPVPEHAPTRPLNPYGRSKLMTEWMLQDAHLAHGIRYVILRYFNVAGADPRGLAGFCCSESNHLIKSACEVALGVRDYLPIYGTDYPTRDGTCIRDFIHVSDLAAAHVAALQYLDDGGQCTTLNCGYGNGSSVHEVIDAVGRIADRQLPVVIAARRLGDPAEVIADARLIRTTLKWKPIWANLEMIVQHTLERLMH